MNPSHTIAVGLECTRCGMRSGLNEKVVICTRCGGIIDVKCDLSRLKTSKKHSLKSRLHSLWRYREFLPIVRDDCIISMGEGLTPLRTAAKYGASIGLSNLILKLDFLNPTGSFKDRGCSVNVSKLKELKVMAVMDDSSGNAGSSLAAYCAAAGIECTLYTPAEAPKEKLIQAEMYGAKVIRVPGTRTDVAQAAEERWKTTGLYYASHNLSPFFLEGMKTLAYEVCEDLDWLVPDHVIFPVGGGTLMVGAWKGFKELQELGWISDLPKFHCVQSESCMPIVEALRKGSRNITPVEERETIAGGIRISNPARGEQVIHVVRDSRGEAVSVDDESIMKHQAAIAKSEGVFPEPTSCAALAGLEKLLEMGAVGRRDSVIVPLTGFGLKDIGTAARSLSTRHSTFSRDGTS